MRKWNKLNPSGPEPEGKTATTGPVLGGAPGVGNINRPNPWHRPSSMLLLALWFGLLIGWVEASCAAILHGLNQCMLDLVNPYLWSIPTIDAGILAIPGLALYMLGRLRIVTCPLNVVTFLFSFVLFSNTIMAVGAMLQASFYWWATILLAGGLAMQVQRFSTRYPQAFHKLVSVTTPGLVVLIAVLAGLTLGHDALTRGNKALSIPQAPANSPNVLLIVLDTVRAKSMSVYGYGRRTTPKLEQWAKRGVVFDQAVSPAPFTLTSHASMFTGRYPQELSADWSVPLDRAFPTLAEVLYEHGYMTAGFVANTDSAGRQTGLDRGFILYKAHRLKPNSLLKSNSLCRLIMPPPLRISLDATRINAHFLEFLTQRKERPFFVFLNYMEAHAPYWTEAPLDRPDAPYLPRDWKKLLKWTFESFKNPGATGLELARESYDACVSKLDRAVDDLLMELEKRGELARTIVIIVGDHGEQFGEHGLVQHADSLYRSVLHVPLMIFDPRRSAGGRRVHTLVSLRDLPATILELLGLPGTLIPGDSFAGLITAQSAPASARSRPRFAFVSGFPIFPDWHPNSKGPVRAVFVDGMHYIKSERREELYDFENDPEEKLNLADYEASAPLMNHCRQLILRQAE